MSETYENPLISRYASKEMLYLFSPEKKFRTWRQLWIALAEAEKELGINISDQQIAAMKQYQNQINYEVAKEQEKKVRHDVMSHVYAFGEQAQSAKPIIHLGATSCYVGDNTDIILMYQGLELIQRKLVNVIHKLSEFALRYKDLPTLGFTHFQPAQLTTVGKRACLWIEDLLIDYQLIEQALATKKLRGVKGTTGTQASFLALFDGDVEKVKQLEQLVCHKIGYDDCYPVTGQTYPRKLDAIILNLLSGVAQSAYKFSNDLRLLQNQKEIEEPFASGQIGSSAMAYKRNPMRSERIGSLSKYVIVSCLNPALTAGTQWLERTLDDSANKRLAVAESFLAVDGILDIYHNVAGGLVVYEKVIAKHIAEELPFMATEVILMEGVKKGGDRQELHEIIRTLSMQAGEMVKVHGKKNDLIERIAKHEGIDFSQPELEQLLEARNFIGMAPIQVTDFIQNQVQPIVAKNQELIEETTELKV